MEKLITNDLIQKCVETLKNETQFKENVITYEVQDDANFLLITVIIDQLNNVTSNERRSAAKLIDLLVPQRNGEYSWMINFVKNKEIVDSYFGGDLNCPDSGL